MRQLHAARPAALAAAAFAALAVLTACGTETGDPGAAGGGQPSGSTASSPADPASPSHPTGPVTSVPSETNLPSSPGKGAPPVVGEPSGPVLRVTGVAEQGVEPGCLVLRANSKSYLLIGAQDKVRIGVPITVTGQVLTGVMSYCQQGTPLRVDSVTKG